MLNQQELLEKYWEIIKEEVNVKEIWPFISDRPITKVFKPIGSQLSAKFGKDTGQIIANGKQGHIKQLDNGKVEVFSPEWASRILNAEDYEIAYEGLDGNDIAVEGNMIAKLDLNLTPELEREGLARELSRFLNQMRKDADFPIDARVKMFFITKSETLETLLSEFGTFLQGEALLSTIEKGEENWSITATFTSNKENIEITLSL